MKKLIYIIPGYSEFTKERKYQIVGSFFKKKGYSVKYVDINWKYKTMSDYVKEFEEKVSKDNTTNFSVLGFSFGAMIAFISATHINFKNLYLCSLSPYFKEDVSKLKDSWKKAIGKRKLKDVNNFSFNKIVKSIKCKSLLFVGEKEHLLVLNRVKETHKKIRNSSLIIVPNAKHEMGYKNYLKCLRGVIE